MLGVDEPFAGLFTQGMVIHETYRAADGEWVEPDEVTIETEGNDAPRAAEATGAPVEIGTIEKMSKSKHNTVGPDEIFDTYGVDAARWFVLSDTPPERDVVWTRPACRAPGGSCSGCGGWSARRPTARRRTGAPRPDAVRRGRDRAAQGRAPRAVAGHRRHRAAALQRLRRAHLRVRQRVRHLARLAGNRRRADDYRLAVREAAEILVRLFHPMMPHLAEECWAALGHKTLVATRAVARARAGAAGRDHHHAAGAGQRQEARRRHRAARRQGARRRGRGARARRRAARLEGKPPKKVIVVPGRIVNVVA